MFFFFVSHLFWGILTGPFCQGRVPASHAECQCGRLLVERGVSPKKTSGVLPEDWKGRLGGWFPKIMIPPNHPFCDTPIFGNTQVVVSNIFDVHPENLGQWSNMTIAYFSTGLVQPPTRRVGTWIFRWCFDYILDVSPKTRGNDDIAGEIGRNHHQLCLRCEWVLIYSTLGMITIWAVTSSPWLLAVYRGWHTTQLYIGLFHKPCNKDPYQPTRMTHGMSRPGLVHVAHLGWTCECCSNPWGSCHEQKWPPEVGEIWWTLARYIISLKYGCWTKNRGTPKSSILIVFIYPL